MLPGHYSPGHFLATLIFLGPESPVDDVRKTIK